MNSHVLKFVPILAYLFYGTSVFVFTVDVCCTFILVLSNDGVNIKIIAMEGLKPWVKMIFTSKWSVLDGDMLSVCPYSKKATVTLHEFATTNWILMILNKNSPVFLFCVIAYIYICICVSWKYFYECLFIMIDCTFYHVWHITISDSWLLYSLYSTHLQWCTQVIFVIKHVKLYFPQLFVVFISKLS